MHERQYKIPKEDWLLIQKIYELPDAVPLKSFKKTLTVLSEEENFYIPEKWIY